VRRGRQMSPAADLLFGMLLDREQEQGATGDVDMSCINNGDIT
jgi:hypothetical protein